MTCATVLLSCDCPHLANHDARGLQNVRQGSSQTFSSRPVKPPRYARDFSVADGHGGGSSRKLGRSAENNPDRLFRRHCEHNRDYFRFRFWRSAGGGALHVLLDGASFFRQSVAVFSQQHQHRCLGRQSNNSQRVGRKSWGRHRHDRGEQRFPRSDRSRCHCPAQCLIEFASHKVRQTYRAGSSSRHHGNWLGFRQRSGRRSGGGGPAVFRGPGCYTEFSGRPQWRPFRCQWDDAELCILDRYRDRHFRNAWRCGELRTRRRGLCRAVEWKLMH